MNNNIPTGNKPSPLGPIPEDWEVKRMGEIFNFKNGINASKDSYGNGTKFVNTMDVLNNTFLNYENLRGKVIINEHTKKEFAVSLGDVLFNRTSETREEVGCSAVYIDHIEPVFGGFIIRAHDIEPDTLDIFYKGYCFQANYIRNQISALGNGAIRYNLGQEDLSRVKLLVPPLSEQRRIVSVLSLWDTAISKQTALIEKLTLRKRGLMQQLLTGKKRLKGFEDCKFQSMPFDRIAKIINVKPFQISKSDYQDYGGTPVVDQGQSFIAAYTDTKYIFSDIPFVLFGDHTRIVKWIDFPCVIGADGVQAIKSKGEMDIKYLYYLLSNTELPNLGYSRHMSILKEKVFNVPTEIKLQQAIAKCLTSADKEIEMANKKLARLQEEKKGLMQVLLTGKRRVK